MANNDRMGTQPKPKGAARKAGVILHPTSLPGKYGIGDLGKECYKFLDWMKSASLSVWQILPLGPTGYGDSPYQCFSAFAGNPFLISPELLEKEGLLSKSDLKKTRFPKTHVDYGPVIEWKNNLLEKAYENYTEGKFDKLTKKLNAFKRAKSRANWLPDYCIYTALKEAHDGQVWLSWPKEYRSYSAAGLEKAKKLYKDRIKFHEFVQFLFYQQWQDVRAYAKYLGIEIMGDIPIYVAFDSSDTWANQQLFDLHKNGNPKNVAGVPPDYFSETGQLWGNPLYNWNKMKKNGYAWWISRFKAILDYVDIIRLDHFRGFEAFWQVPAGEETAINGKWVKGPGTGFFSKIKEELGDLPIIAENLGVITDEVEEIRYDHDLPGMKVLQFAWGSEKSPLRPADDNTFIPHFIDEKQVVYTGTHDNPTSLQWWEEFATKTEKELLISYLTTDAHDVVGDLVRCAFQSRAELAVIPMQDFLRLGGAARMNFPGKASGNWSWRLKDKDCTSSLARQIRDQLALYGRLN